VTDPGLLVHYIWTPVLPADDRTAALAMALRFADHRAHHWWDADRELAYSMADTLRISRGDSLGQLRRAIAWDVYLIYGRGRSTLSEPDFWMHQLAVKHAPRLDPGEFRRRVECLLWP
jgi:hypothetical protein